MIWLDIDPNLVKPGWTPLLITILIAAAIVVLYFSMKKQFRRIDVSQFQGGVDRRTDPAPAADEPKNPA